MQRQFDYSLTPYASATTTRRNMEALKRYGWRILLTPDTVARRATNEGMNYAIDNGAYGCYLRSVEFDTKVFERLLRDRGRAADWVVVPDIVAAGHESLRFSLEWLPECRRRCQLSLLAVQDGMTAENVIPHLAPDVGIFVGGTTEWKLATLDEWGEVAALFGCYLHVGRVNSAQRIEACGQAAADSFDGTSATRYAVNAKRLAQAARWQSLHPRFDPPPG